MILAITESFSVWRMSEKFLRRISKKKCQKNYVAGGFGNSVVGIFSPPRRGVGLRPGGWGLAGGVVAVGGGRPPMRAHSPGRPARFPFCVLSFVS